MKASRTAIRRGRSRRCGAGCLRSLPGRAGQVRLRARRTRRPSRHRPRRPRAASFEDDRQERLRQADALRLAGQPRALAHPLLHRLGDPTWLAWARMRAHADLERVGHVDPQVRLLDAA